MANGSATLTADELRMVRRFCYPPGWKPCTGGCAHSYCRVGKILDAAIAETERLSEEASDAR